MAIITFYNLWKLSQFDGSIGDSPINFSTDTIKVALVSSGYVPNQSHTTWADASANEVSGTNYTSGGNTLTITVGESAGTVTVDAADTSWLQSGSGFNNARYGILYKDSTSDPLIGYIDFVTDRDNVVGSFTIQWNALGIFTLS